MGLVSLYSFAICRDFSEFVGVSVKELVKAIGESRANGNGPTPPETPRRLSRSSSPKNPQGGSPRFHSPSSSPVPIPGTYTTLLSNSKIAPILSTTDSFHVFFYFILSSLIFSFFSLFLTCDLILNLVHSRVCLTSHFWHRNWSEEGIISEAERPDNDIRKIICIASNGFIFFYPFRERNH